MMMTRLNTTLLSFSWYEALKLFNILALKLYFIVFFHGSFKRSDKIDGKIPDHVAKIISRVTSVLPNSKLQLGLSDVLAARKELVSNKTNDFFISV